MEIRFYQAECGDAAQLIFTGTDGLVHHIFIDSGFERTYKSCLRNEIYELATKKELVDLWIISHIHSDHIGGAVKYIKSILNGEIADIVESWWYNFPRTHGYREYSVPLSASSAISVAQGDFLTTYFIAKGSTGKQIDNKCAPFDISGMKIDILAPSTEQLDELRTKYKIAGIPLETEESKLISSAIVATGYDYHIKLYDFNLHEFAEDTSIENASSIVLITEFNKQKILWLADAPSSQIVYSLTERGYSKENKLKCEWIKVSHHGSKINLSNELISMLDCNNYLLSANAENINYLPTKEVIARILRNEHRDRNSFYHFWFTYDNTSLRSMFSVDSSRIFTDLRFNVHYSDEKYLRAII